MARLILDGFPDNEIAIGLLRVLQSGGTVTIPLTSNKKQYVVKVRPKESVTYDGDITAYVETKERLSFEPLDINFESDPD
jgi:hypothetical protein